MAAPTARSRGPLLVIGAIVVVGAIAAAAGLWYLFFRPAGPAPVSLSSLAPVAVADSPGTGSSSGAAAGIGGTWKVDSSIGSLDDGSGTFVGYRVQEQLATVGAQEAVGRTSDVTGSITIDGAKVTAGDFTADLTTLQSDEANRDRQLTHQALQTSLFPTATFKLTQPIDLGSVPADGKVVQATATGDLTLHGVTKSVQVPLEARLDGNVITVAGSLPITFADYGIQQPQAIIVLSVEDHGTMEFQLHFTRG